MRIGGNSNLQLGVKRRRSASLYHPENNDVNELCTPPSCNLAFRLLFSFQPSEQGYVMRSLWVLLAVGVIHTASAEVFQCTDASGNTVFTDQPCQGQGKRIEIDVPERPIDRYLRKKEEEKAQLLARIERDLEKCGSFTLDEIKEADRVEIGMTADEVLWVRGRRPSRTNRSAYGPEQWVYELPAATHYIYVQDGCVVNWQR